MIPFLVYLIRVGVLLVSLTPELTDFTRAPPPHPPGSASAGRGRLPSPNFFFFLLTIYFPSDRFLRAALDPIVVNLEEFAPYPTFSYTRASFPLRKREVPPRAQASADPFGLLILSSPGGGVFRDQYSAQSSEPFDYSTYQPRCRDFPPPFCHYSLLMLSRRSGLPTRKIRRRRANIYPIPLFPRSQTSSLPARRLQPAEKFMLFG